MDANAFKPAKREDNPDGQHYYRTIGIISEPQPVLESLHFTTLVGLNAGHHLWPTRFPKKSRTVTRSQIAENAQHNTQKCAWRKTRNRN